MSDNIFINQFMKLISFFDRAAAKNDNESMLFILYQMRLLHGKLILHIKSIENNLLSNTVDEDEHLFFKLSYTRSIDKEMAKQIIKKEKLLKKNSEDNNLQSIITNTENTENSENSEKTENTEEMLDRKYDLDKATIVLFYTSPENCKHVENFIPIWNKITDKFKDKNLNIIKINCENNPTLCKKFSVGRFFPTVKSYYKNRISELLKLEEKSLDNFFTKFSSNEK
jgi:hypothetical protein